jgi:hypothetical protein
LGSNDKFASTPDSMQALKIALRALQTRMPSMFSDRGTATVLPDENAQIRSAGFGDCGFPTSREWYGVILHFRRTGKAKPNKIRLKEEGDLDADRNTDSDSSSRAA